MDIFSIANSLIAQSFSRQSTQPTNSASDLVAAAFKNATNRVDQQLGSTKVQLSAFGQIKSAFSEVQTAGNALGDKKQTATTSDLKTAIGNFVNAFNKTNTAVSTATQGTGTEAAALPNNSRAAFAGSDLQRSAKAGDTLSALSKIGITQNKNGSFSVDTKALDKALQANPDQVRSTVAKLGSQVAKTAANELASNGNVGGSVNTLTSRSHSLEAQQSSQLNQIAAAQRLVDQQTARINSVYNVSAYQRTFTG